MKTLKPRMMYAPQWWNDPDVYSDDLNLAPDIRPKGYCISEKSTPVVIIDFEDYKEFMLYLKNLEPIKNETLDR